MKLIAILLIGIFCLANIVASTHLTESIVHLDHPRDWDGGFWRKKWTWKARWIKTWKAKKVYVGIWKRVWGPAEIKEWVPIPKPPPGWVKHY